MIKTTKRNIILFVKSTINRYNIGQNHYKRAVIMNTRTSNRSMLCWADINGSHCLCFQCWSCRRKMSYQTKVVAKEKAIKASTRTKSKITFYSCSFCNFFHIGHVMRSN